MIIKKQSILNNDYSISVPTIDISYLKEINNFFNGTDILNNLFDKATALSIIINEINHSDVFLNLINNIEIYYEGIDSSKIEGINLNSNNPTLNKHKIECYIKATKEIYEQNKPINIETLEWFHLNIEPDKIQGIRTNTPQYIANHKAPEGKHLTNALNNFFQIYLGNDGFDDINLFVRWAYQHILFEVIHPFDDGNGRTGRMLNLMFFKNQHSDIFDNILLETSTSIFDNLDQYYQVLSDCRVYIRNEVYDTDIKKSLTKDISACNFLLNRLLEKLNYTISYMKRYSNNIDTIIKIFDEDKFLKKYKNDLLNFFSTHIRFTRIDLKNHLDIAEATTSKLMNLLEQSHLIEDDNSINKIKNTCYKVFTPFNNIKDE